MSTTTSDQTMAASNMRPTPVSGTMPFRSRIQVILANWMQDEKGHLEEARVKLERMYRDAWLMRYEDYLDATPASQPLWHEAKKARERALEETGREVKKVDDVENVAQAGSTSRHQDPVSTTPEHPEAITIKTFLSQSWAEIKLLLDQEAASLITTPDRNAVQPPTPFLDLIIKLWTLSDPSPWGASIDPSPWASLDLYVEQCTRGHEHIHIGQLAYDGHSSTVAEIMRRDLVDLHKQKWRGFAVTDREKCAARMAIMALARCLFKSFAFDSRSGTVSWTAWPVLL